ncbi:RNA polymerase sigma factor [Sphingobacterium sp. 1.A.4]|uniref:RNA polymerase sigma factor n=1 Tax=Sphingobacterium sp. 1.A.4 TaxID=2044603 RepID=UPI00211E12AD|nr:sigma-70 family RNA polymerase sigma factor [Sphingobacterium sp. 1.A.4]
MSKQTNHTDEELLQAYLQAGDLTYLGELFQRHSEMLYYVCLRYFKEPERSRDAVMQIFEELIEKVKKQDIQDFPRWLYVVGKNHCLMALRSAKNKMEIVTDSFVEFGVNLHQEENYQDKEEQLSQLERCIEVLIDKQKQSIQLFFIEQKCYKEVSEITGYSLNDVKSYIQNGKRNLKNCMERSGNE